MADYFKLRGGVYFVDSMPETITGKIARYEVKRNAQQLFNTKPQTNNSQLCTEFKY